MAALAPFGDASLNLDLRIHAIFTNFLAIFDIL